MEKLDNGFTLIELLIVIAIIGVLAAVAIPYYEGHKVKAKLAEVMNSMSTVASAISGYYHDNGTFPNCSTKNEVKNSLGVSLGSITRVSEISIINGVISATVSEIHPMVDGKYLTLSPSLGSDGSLKWTWGWSSDFPVQFRPKGN